MSYDKKVKNFSYYLPRIIKFYDLKIEFLSPIIFTLLLVISCISNYLLVNYTFEFNEIYNRVFDSKSFVDSLNLIQMNSEVIREFYDKTFKIYSTIFLEKLLVGLISGIYIVAYVNQLKKSELTLGEIIKTYFKRVPIYILGFLSIWIMIVVSVSTIIFVVFSIILYFMFLLYEYYIFDKGFGVFKSFKCSARVMKGNKLKMLSVFIVFKTVFYLLNIFTIGFEGELLSIFVTTFISTISVLMYKRLLGTIYYELEYDQNKNTIDVQV